MSSVPARLWLIVPLGLWVASASEASDPTVRVVVYVSTDAHAETVKDGLAEAARIYRRGGVAIAWSKPTAELNDGTIYLHVIGQPERGVDTDDITLGAAPRGPGGPGRIAYVFLQPIQELAHRHRVDPSLVLGAAITHELAHLLLPNGGHSDKGVMRARWGAAEVRAADQGVLRFSAQELMAIREGLTPPLVAASRARRE